MLWVHSHLPVLFGFGGGFEITLKEKFGLNLRRLFFSLLLQATVSWERNVSGSQDNFFPYGVARRPTSILVFTWELGSKVAIAREI